MTVTQTDVKRIRRMIAEPTSITYTDSDLIALIEEKQSVDINGLYPDDSNWTPTYDLFLVASEIWLEKASIVSDEFDFHADGGTFQREQKHKMALEQASYYASRSKGYNLKMKQDPLTKIFVYGQEDQYYKDNLDDYESSLV